MRPARPLPYQPDASGVVVGGEVRLALRNSGDESVHLALFPHAGEFEAPAHFDVRSSVDVTVPFDGRYRFTVVGPNGFRREFAGARGESVAVESSTHGHSRVLSMTCQAASRPPFTSNETIAPPLRCCLRASAYCGCDSNPG